MNKESKLKLLDLPRQGRQLTKIKSLALGALAIAACGLQVHAALINVDFNGGSYQNGVPNGPTQTGAAVVGSAGDLWNGFIDDADVAAPVRTGEALVDATGAPTSVTLDYTLGFNYDSMSWGTSPFVTAGSSVADLMVEFAGVGAGKTGTLTLRGLAPGQYELYLYAAADSPAAGQARVTTFTANGLTGSVGPNNGSSTLTPGVNYLRLTPTVAADGLLDVSFTGGTGEGDLNGFQLRPAILSTPPFFTTQPTPTSVTRFKYGQATFTAAVDGTQPISLQWQHGANTIPGATNATLVITNIQASDAGSYTLVASNVSGTTPSQAATLTIASTPAQFVVSFDFDCGGDTWPGTYSGPGVLGSGSFWNPITGPNNWATGTYTSSSSLAEDGTSDTGVLLTLVTAGNWAGAGNSTLLDDFACAYSPNAQPFTFKGVPDGLYRLVLFGANAPFADTRGTIFTVGGEIKATTNAAVNPSAFTENDNYVVFHNLIVTNGMITGTWAANPVPHGSEINPEGDINGAQLQRIGDVSAFVAPSVSKQPQSKTVYERMPVSFTVSGAGSPAPTYQWQKNNSNLPGATTDTFNLSSVSTSDAGDYTVVLLNPAGSITSSVATVTVLLAPPAPPAGSFSAAVLTNSPIAYWRLDDADGTQLLYDSMGRHIAANGNVTLGVAGPRSPAYPGFSSTSRAASFNGTNSAATSGASLMNGLTNFTLMGWINPAGPNTDRVGLFGQNDAVEFGYNDTDGVYLWIPTSIGGWVNPKSGTEGFNLGQWYFVTLVADGKNVTIYVNGTQRGQVANVGAPTGFSGYGFNIGGGGIIDATGNNFNGSIGDVAVFDKALSDQQINSLYNVAAGLIAPSIVSQPTAQTALQGFPVKLTLAAAGAPLFYQWQAGPAGGPYTNLIEGANISGTRSSTLTIANVALNQAGDYRVMVTNSAGSVTSDAATLSVDPLPAPWTVNFDFDCSEGGFVGTYSGAGVIGSGTYWNAIPGPSAWEAKTYTSSGGLIDDGTIDTKISLILTTGGSWSYAPSSNALLDDYATSDANGKPFLFNNIPDGLYNLVLFGADGGWHDRGTIFTVNGLKKITANASSASLVEGDNCVIYRNLPITGGSLAGTYAANPNVHGGNNNEGQFCGAQLQYIGPAVTLSVQPAGNGCAKLQWSQGTLLETTDLVSGTWSPVPGATSPYTNSPTGTQKFYRVKLQ